MIPSHPPTFIVNHGGVHRRCKKTLKKSDIKIQSYESLNLLAEPLKIYCHHCQEDFWATSIDVWLYINLSIRELFYEVSIAEVLGQREKLEIEYRSGLKVVSRRELDG